MARAHGNVPEADVPRQFANAAFVQVDSERSRDPFTQIDQPPANDPVGLGVGASPHPYFKRRLLRSGQFSRRAATVSAIERTAQTLIIEAMDPVSEYLTVHAALTRGIASGTGFQNECGWPTLAAKPARPSSGPLRGAA